MAQKRVSAAASRVDRGRIELEILCLGDSLSEETMAEIVKAEARLFLVDLPKEPERGIRILEQLHQRFPQLPTLATGDSCDPSFLIQAMRLGVIEFLARPLNSEKLEDAYYRISKHIFHNQVEKTSARLFSFFGSSGGSGATTIATNFAVSLRKLTKGKVLIVDLNLQLGNVADFFGVKSNRSQARPDASVSAPQFTSDIIVSHQMTGIDILSLTDYYPQTRPMAAEIKPVLSRLQRDYNHIVVDCSSKLDDNTVAVLDASQLIFLVARCNLPSIRNTKKVLHVFERLGYPQDRIRLLINRYSKCEPIGLKELERVLNFKVFWPIPNDFRALIQSIQMGEPLAHKSQSIPVFKNFHELTARVLEVQVDQEADCSKGGVLIRAKNLATKSLALTTLNLSKS